MAGVTAHGASFAFSSSGISSFVAAVVGVSVETPTAEVVDMSGVGDLPGYIVAVPTGDWSGGSITVDYLRTAATQDPQGLVRKTGLLAFASQGFSYSRRVICESASTEARSGELVRGSLRFRITDYTGT